MPDQTEVGRPRDLNQLETAAARFRRRVDRVSWRKKSFFALADGANRIRAGAETAPAQGSRLRHPEDLRRDLIDSIADYRREQSQSADRGFQSRRISPERTFLPASRRRIARRKGARLGVRTPPAASDAACPPLSRRAYCRTADTGPGHRFLRPIRARERTAGFRHAQRGR